MDLYINKYNSVVLTDEELDVIGDAVENLLFNEFFSERDTSLIVIHTAHVEDDALCVYRILTARERDFLDHDVKDRFYTALFDQFSRINSRLASSEESKASPVHIGESASEFRIGPKSGIGTMALLSEELGAIYLSFLSEDDEQFDAGCMGLVGLMNIVCQLISKRYPIIGELLPELPKVPFYACEEKDAAIINKTIERWFKTERESLKQWRSTLEAPQ